MKGQQLISDPQARALRTAEKRDRVLAWLADEGFSIAPVLSQALGYSTRSIQAVLTTLRRLETEGYISRHEMALPARRPLVLWGLTPHGAVMATDPAAERDVRHFDPGRVSLITIQHALDVQQARIRAEQYGWTGWRGTRSAADFAREGQFKDERGNVQTGWPKVPDALGRDPGGALVAIEIERRAKTPKRYREIIAHYLMLAAQRQVERVDYVCPDERVASRLAGIWKRTESVRIGVKTYPLTDSHRATFTFSALDEWPKRS